MNRGGTDMLAPRGYWPLYDAYGWARQFRQQGDSDKAERWLLPVMEGTVRILGSQAAADTLLSEVTQDYESLMRIQEGLHGE